MAPATCGELVQGFGRGRWLQIAAPVDLYRTARATVVPSGRAGRAEGAASRRYAKVQRGLEVLLQRRPGRALRVALGGDEVPRGAGFGSSTADLGAALRAAAAALGLDGPGEAVVGTALEVEPTSGALLPGLVLFDHRGGTIREPLGPPPALNILCIRLPGVVDTVTFNRDLPTRLPAHAVKAWRLAFRLCAEGIADADAGKIGAAATASAEAARHLGCPPAPPGLAGVCPGDVRARHPAGPLGHRLGASLPGGRDAGPGGGRGHPGPQGGSRRARAARALARDGRVAEAGRRRLPGCPARKDAAIVAD